MLNKEDKPPKLNFPKSPSPNFSDISPREAWEMAKNYLDRVEFPDEEAGRKKFGNWEHTTRQNQTHSLEVYVINRKVEGFSLEFEYVRCPACNEIKRKTGTLFSEFTGLTYHRIFGKSW